MSGRVSRTWRRVRAARAPDIVRAARQTMRFLVTCVHAAKYLPTVRRAVPWYIWPLLAVASAVKTLPVDFGVDEVLFTLAFALIAWRRPGLLRALYREAQAGKPAPCRCPRHT
jgi:hypothetical protein